MSLTNTFPIDSLYSDPQSKTFSLHNIINCIKQNSLSDFITLLLQNQLDLSNLDYDLSPYAFDFDHEHTFLNIFKSLANFNFSFSKLSKLSIFRNEALFDYVLDNNLGDLNIFADKTINSDCRQLTEILNSLNYAQFEKLILYYNLNIWQTFSFNFSKYQNSFISKRSRSSHSQHLNLFAFFDDEKIIEYLLKNGLDIYHNFREGFIGGFNLSELLKHMDLTLLEDPIIYNLLNYVDFLELKRQQQILNRLLIIDNLDFNYHLNLLRIVLVDKIMIFKKGLKKYLQNCKALENVLNPADLLLKDFCQIVLVENDYNLREIKARLDIILQIYPLDYTHTKFFLNDSFKIAYRDREENLDDLNVNYESTDIYDKVHIALNLNQNHIQFEGYKIMFILYKLKHQNFEDYLIKFYHSIAEIKSIKEIEYADFKRLLLESFEKFYYRNDLTYLIRMFLAKKEDI